MEDFVAGREPFLKFLKGWARTLPSPKLADVIAEAGGPENVALVTADLTLGFTRIGNLASPRIDAVVPANVELLKLAHSLGVRNFVLPQDAHPADSPQFAAYGPHAIPGTEEAKTVPELANLPFADLFTIIPKQNLNPGIDTMFPLWLEEHPNVKRFIVTGDCTDLCIYQTVTYLRLRANQFKFDYEVLVPENCVQTFDTEFDKARRLGILPHDADLLHLLFLYHMELNGIRVAARLVADEAGNNPDSLDIF
ncbi:MAG: cysteine hydrolase family protein [Armatimonadota bacterium]